jgi:phage baseplate assembly protein W
MPLIQSKRQINPLSTNSNVTIGVAFPLDDVNLFSGTQTVKEQIKTNLLNVLLTEKGERINQPNFGVGLKYLLFESDIDEEEIADTLDQQIKTYIPEISILETKVEPMEDEHLLYILITYRFNLDETDDSIQINFQ